jgi:hypothetical protein
VVRYLSGLCVCGLGLVAGGWLSVAAVLLRGAPSNATLVSASTGAGVALVSAVGVACWSVAWRQRMRLDGVLIAQAGPVSSGQARRNRRALRRDMRRAARIARGSRRNDAPHSACPVPPARVVPPAGLVPPQGRVRPAGVVPRPGAARPASVVPSQGMAAPASAGSPEAAVRPGGCCPPATPATVLTELRALLEPLLTTGPVEAVPGADAAGEETW